MSFTHTVQILSLQLFNLERGGDIYAIADRPRHRAVVCVDFMRSLGRSALGGVHPEVVGHVNATDH